MFFIIPLGCLCKKTFSAASSTSVSPHGCLFSEHEAVVMQLHAWSSKIWIPCLTLKQCCQCAVLQLAVGQNFIYSWLWHGNRHCKLTRESKGCFNQLFICQCNLRALPGAETCSEGSQDHKITLISLELCQSSVCAGIKSWSDNQCHSGERPQYWHISKLYQ